MQDVFILNLETSSTVCSVSISHNGKNIFLEEADNGYTHAENLHLFIQNSSKASNVPLKKLSAIAISTGPGSYTGLRIGMSTAKGLCYALNLPLLAINTLQSLANRANHLCSDDTEQICIMTDARRMEVYTALFDRNLNDLEKTTAKIISETSFLDYNGSQKVCFAGDGVLKAIDLLKKKEGSEFITDLKPSAMWLESISYSKYKLGNFSNLAYCEPEYGKEFYTPNPK